MSGYPPYMRIHAAVLRAPGERFSVEELDLEPPHSGEVLVKLSATGVCHSDWHIVSGATSHPMPVVPGHEGAGIVEAVGAGVTNLEVGDHVSLNWAPSCGTCFYCLRDRHNLCSAYLKPIWAGTMLDGTTRLTLHGQPIYHFSALACFAEKTVVPQQCCVPLPKTIPLEVAALVGCAVTTGVGAVLNTAKVLPGSSVAVFGVGGVGLSIVMGAYLAGASQIIAIDRSQAKLDTAKLFGATDGILSDDQDIYSIQGMTEGRGADYVFEAVGIPSIQEKCLDVARPGGVVVFAGISPMGSSTNLPGSILTRQEKTVMGSYYGTSNPARDFPLYADLYMKGRLDLDRLISKRYSLDQINEAYADMLSGSVARGVVMF